MKHIKPLSNIDLLTVEGFGEEWSAFDQTKLSPEEIQSLFNAYFASFRWDLVNRRSVGFDMGCGSGRWAKLLAPRVSHLHCIDPSEKALSVARRNLQNATNVTFHHAGVDVMPLKAGSMDFGVSLGVLHHVPDTAAAICTCVTMLKPGAPLLLYLYYRFDNRPRWYPIVWRTAEFGRSMISHLSPGLRIRVTDVIAVLVYWPLARLAKLLERLGVNVSNLPLSAYRTLSFYTMRTDALDRFGTRLEQRFTRKEIAAMLTRAGCVDIRFSEHEPFWCVCARRAG